MSDSSCDDIDLSQFSAIFFEEAADNIEQLEAKLLALDVANVDDEELNAIFRCAHSVKGGAATFGFRDVAELTHETETLLDKLRRRELAATTEMVDVLLSANDALRAMIARHQGDGSEAVDNTALIERLRVLASGQGTQATRPAADAAPPQAAAARKPAGKKPGRKKPTPAASQSAADPAAKAAAEPLAQATAEPAPSAQSPTVPAAQILQQDAGFGLFDGAPGTPPPQRTAPAPVVKPQASDRVATADTTLRVPVEKVDQLINLVGELVITQAMLAQSGVGLDSALHQRMSAGLADLERNTRALQEAVMSIRMIPMSVVFNRFPRMLRDLATKLGKTVELETVGEATELDKGLVEKITDPLTHLVRNSCDHGIELPAQRLAAGKPAAGTITLAASHQGGSIVIEVRDDGRGLSREKLLKKARERGLDAPDTLSDAEVWSLIFAPGFSTAEQVTDVSGRGVGMDVVKKNITALGGTVEIDSIEGKGMSVKVRLPLTLAIMDGMSVAVGEESYILPLGSVVESFQPQPDQLQTIAGRGRVVRVRDEYLPVVDLDRLMSVPRDAHEVPSSILVVVEAEGSRVALRVDELLGQQQVVVKNIEENYRRVEHVAGATILGDGRVALILDTGSLARPAMH